MTKGQNRLNLIDDFVIAEILAMTDEDAVVEAGEADIGASAGVVRNAQLVAGRRRYEQIQADLRAARLPANVVSIDRAKQRAKWSAIVATDAALTEKLTLAARNKTEGEDHDGILDDLAELEAFIRPSTAKASTKVSHAEHVLQELGISQPKDIDIEVIAWHLGAKVKFRALSDCEARIVGRDNHAVISVDDKKPFERQRFSVGHELGHWHHHRGRCLICRSEDIGNARQVTAAEKIADLYAADLLLPRYIFEPFMTSFTTLSVKVLREIKANFRVSLTAAALRAIDISAFPAMIVCHNQAGRRWFKPSPLIPSRWFPRNELDPESYAFDMLFGGANEPPHPRRVKADKWFCESDANRYHVQEHSFALPGNEVATLLVLDDKDMLNQGREGIW